MVQDKEENNKGKGKMTVSEVVKREAKLELTSMDQNIWQK